MTKNWRQKKKFNLPTELHAVTIDRTYIMKIESIDNVHEEKTNTIPPKPKTKPARRGRPAKGTIQFLLSRRIKKIKDIGLALNDELTKIQLTLNVPSSNRYANYTLNSERICVIKPLKDRIRLIYSKTENIHLKESDFVYSTKNNRQGEYASDIMTRADIGRALQIVKSICNNEKAPESPRASKVKSPQIRNTARGSISKTSAQKPTISNAEFEFNINGQKFQGESAIDTVKKIVEYLAGNDDQFLKRLEAMEHGKTRRYIAQDKNELYPGRSDLTSYSFEIPTALGWYLGTNYNKTSLKKIAALAKQAADSKIRDTMTGNIFELYKPKHTKPTTKEAADPKIRDTITENISEPYNPKHIKPTPKDAKLVTDDGDEIPYSEDTTNEFKASFTHDYKADEYEKQGNLKAAAGQRKKVIETNFGFGLEWDIAKAIAGFSNSYHEEGRIWVGVKDNKANPPTIRGLRPDSQKSQAKNWEDDFGNWINDLIKKCIRDYKGFDNISWTFPQVSDERICLIKVKKYSRPMMLVNKHDPDHTIFYRRHKSAPRTDRLRGEEEYQYRDKRFPK